MLFRELVVSILDNSGIRFGWPRPVLFISSWEILHLKMIDVLCGVLLLLLLREPLSLGHTLSKVRRELLSQGETFFG
jgi:hypothetical protein